MWSRQTVKWIVFGILLSLGGLVADIIDRSFGSWNISSIAPSAPFDDRDELIKRLRDRVSFLEDALEVAIAKCGSGSDMPFPVAARKLLGSSGAPSVQAFNNASWVCVAERHCDKPDAAGDEFFVSADEALAMCLAKGPTACAAVSDRLCEHDHFELCGLASLRGSESTGCVWVDPNRIAHLTLAPVQPTPTPTTAVTVGYYTVSSESCAQADSIFDETACREAFVLQTPQGSSLTWYDRRNQAFSTSRPPNCFFTRNTLTGVYSLYLNSPSDTGPCGGAYICLCRRENTTNPTDSSGTAAPSASPSWFPSPYLSSDGSFVSLLESSCSAYSTLRPLTTVAGCENAARNLLRLPGVATVENAEALPLPDFPPYCYTDGNFLKINLNGFSFGKCSERYRCLCQVVTGAPIQLRPKALWPLRGCRQRSDAACALSTIAAGLVALYVV